MKTIKKSAVVFSLVAALIGFSFQARAAGFALYEAGTRQLGMAGAVTGLADSPAAIFFNPAGLANQEGLGIELNVALVMPSFGYDTTLPGSSTDISIDAETNTFVIPSFYLNYRLHDRVALGFGTYVPFGLGVEWPKSFTTSDGNSVDWWGRSSIKEIEVQNVALNLSLGLKLHDQVFIGGGFVVGLGAVHLKRALTFSAYSQDDVDVELSGDDVGFGGTAGILVKAVPNLLHIGASFRSAIKYNFAGDAAFTQNGSPNIPSGLRTLLADGKVEAPLTTPNTFTFGVTAFPLENLIVGINVDWVLWSSYEELSVNFIGNDALSSSEKKNWDNVFQLRIGAEYKVLGDNLPIRLGFAYDQSPVPNDTVGPELPDTDRYWLALGVGYEFMGIKADLAYQILFTAKEATGENTVIVGERSASAHILSLGLGYNFDI